MKATRMRYKTVRVAVMVNSDGYWRAFAEETLTPKETFEILTTGFDAQTGQIHWITCKVPIPQELPADILLLTDETIDGETLA